MKPLLISPTTLRRFILGQQGLWPGRRWQSKAGIAQAMQNGSVVQNDPLNIIARSHDIALYGRVLDYTAPWLDEWLYQNRSGFDYGGTVFIHRMESLPYWRVIMQRNSRRGRWGAFADTHSEVVARVLEQVREQGPLAGRDLKGTQVGPGNYRGSKDTGLALYYLWFIGELMTSGRRFGGGGAKNQGGSFERLYDVRERVAPAHLQHQASEEDAEDFFALQTFSCLGMPNLRSFRLWFSGTIERKIDPGEALSRLERLQEAGTILPVSVVGESPLQPRFFLASEWEHLEVLARGEVPADWKALQTTTTEEMTVMAPLEIVSARGRAKELFSFEYVWEVYKPVELRRWGYYTLPLLWGDQLVARFDSRLDKTEHTLKILGFWLEPGVIPNEPFVAALWAGLRRFARFIGAEQVIDNELLPKKGAF